jgi:hypothetical protein
MYRYVTTIIIFFCLLTAVAQPSEGIYIGNTLLAGDGAGLPLWLKANQSGRVKAEGAFLHLTEVYAGQKKPGWFWGVHMVAGLGASKYLQMNQAFAGFSFKGWEMAGGRMADSVRFSGLSSTNGNLARSLNARPYPELRVSSGGYRPVPFTEGLLRFSFTYGEGLLGDRRYVQNTRLHRKSFHLMTQPSPSLTVKAGFEHFVMWGGVSSSKDIGQLPQNFSSYLRYVSGSMGDDSFPLTDRMNVAGNQLGTWQLEIEAIMNHTTATFFLNHPFEDFSGVNWRNWPDNLLGVHLHVKGRKFVSAFLYEFTDTRQQSIRDSLYAWDEESGQWGMNEYDSYFNHGVYRSGYTYHRQMMGSPLFFPVVVEDGMAKGIGSNRFYAHHTGLTGNLTEGIKWKGLITWVHHFGTWPGPLVTPLKQVSGLLEFLYAGPAFPVEVRLSAAADFVGNNSRNTGISLSVSKRW